VALCDTIGNLHELSNSLRMLAYIAMRRDRYERAAVLLGAEYGRRNEAGSALSPREVPSLEAAVKELRDSLGAERYGLLFDQGYSLKTTEMVRLAADDGFLSK